MFTCLSSVPFTHPTCFSHLISFQTISNQITHWKMDNWQINVYISKCKREKIENYKLIREDFKLHVDGHYIFPLGGGFDFWVVLEEFWVSVENQVTDFLLWDLINFISWMMLTWFDDWGYFQSLLVIFGEFNKWLKRFVLSTWKTNRLFFSIQGVLGLHKIIFV